MHRSLLPLLLLLLRMAPLLSAAPLPALTRVVLTASDLSRAPVFEGIGGISGGGATSKLLPGYPAAQRDQILDLLFSPAPSGLAALQILKVEIGGDSQSTDGVEASHMHSADDLDLHRGYEWWLMREAKRRNPAIRLYGLPWVFPGWLGAGSFNPYARNNSNLLRYVVEWVRGARDVHGLHIDFVGIWNERQWTADYIVALRGALDAAGLNGTRIVAADGSLNDIENAVVANKALAAAVDVLGYHYPGARTTANATASGKRLWCSEEYSANNDLAGGGCWARVLTESFVDAGYTAFIAWNLIAAYYDGLPYSRASLMTANQPWSGWFDAASPLWVSAHFTRFMEVGWRYLPVGNGSGHLQGGGSIVALVSPSGRDLTLIVQTLDPSNAPCFYGMPKFNVTQAQEVELHLPAAFASRVQLHAWRSVFNFSVHNASRLFEPQPDVHIAPGGLVRLRLARNELLTLTTVARAPPKVPKPPPLAPFPHYYADDFEAYHLGEVPLLITPQAGTLAVQSGAPAAQPGQVLRQMVTEAPIDTCRPTRMPRPLALVGSNKWRNVRLEVETQLPRWANASSGLFVGVRLATGGCDSQHSAGIFLWLLAKPGVVLLTANANQTEVLGRMDRQVERGRWYSLVLSTYAMPAGGDRVRAEIDGQMVFDAALLSSASTAGWVAFGAADFGVVHFDNVAVKVNA